MTHRLFVGIRPPSEIRHALLGIERGVDGARWQDDAQFHLTLRYVGKVQAHQAEDLAAALEKITFDPFELGLRSTGIFEKKGRANALWAGVDACPPLLRLQGKVERACVTAGLPPEERKFHPHITLARMNRDSSDLAPFLSRNASFASGPWLCEDFVLYESHLRAQGSLYEPICSYRARG